jgi:RNA polymerase sigma-70 factor (ECF subfamily)
VVWRAKKSWRPLLERYRSVFDGVMDDGTSQRHELERLYQRYGALVMRRAHRILGDEQGARDVCHDVFVQVLRTPSWAPPSPLAWLYVATTNRCLNVLRADRRGRLVLARLPAGSPSRWGRA